MLGWIGRCISGGQTIRWEAAEESRARRKTVLVRMEKEEHVRNMGADHCTALPCRSRRWYICPPEADDPVA